MIPASLPRFLLFLAGLILPLLAVLVANGLAPMAAIVGFLALGRLWQCRQTLAMPWSIAALPLMMVAWAALSAAWAHEPIAALASSGRLALVTVLGTVMVLAATTLSGREQRAAAIGLLIGAILAGAILSAEYLTDNSLSGALFEVRGMKPLPKGAKSQFNRGATILAIALWPLTGLLLRHWPHRLAAGAFAVVATILLTGDSLAAKLALLAGAAIFAVALAAPVAARRLVGSGMIAITMVLVLAAPGFPTPPDSFTSLHWLPISAHHRLGVWQFTSSRATEKPVLGWGMEASRSVPGAEERLDALWVDADGTNHGSLTGVRLPLHPHNAILQLWLELGAVGLGLACALVGWIARGTAGRDRLQQAAALAGLTAALVVANVSYGIWQSWWQCALWMIAALCAMPTHEKDKAA
jgi:exopolysaccharide production protein ExoQ